MSITKNAFLAAAGSGDLAVLQQYVAQPEIASLIAALERVLQGDQSTCDNLRTAARTLMAASRGLWFCVNGEWGGVFRRAVVNKQVEVLAWFFGTSFASACPTTLQVVFPHIAGQVVARNDTYVIETLLTSWVFQVAMAPETRRHILQELYYTASSNGHLVEKLLVAHGANERLSETWWI